MKTNKHTLWVMVLALLAGWWSAGRVLPDIAPEPQQDRPILRAVVRLAKVALWIGLMADAPPAQAEPMPQQTGEGLVSHARGW
jgi:hypothetical protein